MTAQGCDGGWVALSPSVMADLLGPQGLGASLGALDTWTGIGARLGPPLAGSTNATSSYRPLILTAICLAVAAGLLIATLPVRRVTSDTEG